MGLLLPFVALTAGAAVALSILYAYQRATAPGRIARARIAPPQADIVYTGGAVLVERYHSPIPFLDKLPISSEARDRMGIELERAGIPLRVSEFLALRLALAAGGALVGALLAASFGAASWVAALVAFGSLLVGWLAPRAYVARARAKRLERIERQLPATLTAIAKALRAGAGLQQALAFAADELPAPIGEEIESLLRDLQLGADPEEAFAALAQRVGSADLDIAVTAIMIQRSVGGNLSEILTTVSETIRARERLHAEVRVLTSRQRLMGKLMAGMPPAIAVLFILLNPEMGRLLIETTAGRIALGIGLAFEVFGLLLVQRFARIEV